MLRVLWDAHAHAMLDLKGGRSAIRYAKLGVAVFKASMLVGGRSASSSAMFGVVVFEASVLIRGVDLPSYV